MPEDFIIEPTESGDIVERFEAFLNAQPSLTLLDVDNMEVVLMARLRSILTYQQLHARAHQLVAVTEHLIQTPGTYTDPDTGEVVPPILVENFEGGAEAVLEMTQSLRELSDDEIMAKFLEQMKGDEEE